MNKLAILLTSAVLATSHSQAADGKAVYATCQACHQADGKGLPGAFPPLAESEWVNGPVENLIRIQLRGLQGPITVKGQQFNSVMPPNATMSDDEIAAVLTYVRSNFGNKSSAVTADQVKALRSEAGKPMLKVEDLVDPSKAPVADTKEEPAADPKPEAKEEPAADPKAEADEAPKAAGEVLASGKVKSMDVDSGSSAGIFGSVFAWAAVCLVPVAVGIVRKG